MARFLGVSLALSGLLVVVLVVAGYFLAPEPILYRCGGTATYHPDGTVECIPPRFSTQSP